MFFTVNVHRPSIHIPKPATPSKLAISMSSAYIMTLTSSMTSASSVSATTTMSTSTIIVYISTIIICTIIYCKIGHWLLRFYHLDNSILKWLVLAFAFFLFFSSTRTVLSSQSVYYISK